MLRQPSPLWKLCFSAISINKFFSDRLNAKKRIEADFYGVNCHDL